MTTHKVDRQDYKVWPTVGYARRGHILAALSMTSKTLDNYMRLGLFPNPTRFGPNAVGWPVDDAKKALAALPHKLNELEAGKFDQLPGRGRPRKGQEAA